MFDLSSYLASRRRLVEEALDETLEESTDAIRIVQAMRYSLMAGGKRLRPVLCMASAEAVGGAAENVLPGACALEMIHTYSLIHDDLPAMDDDDLRRGRPSCHIAFDEATAVLAGDALLTLAFETLAAAGSAEADRALQWLEVIRIIAEAGGYGGMIEGQMKDLAAEGRELTLGELEEMHSHKTGALIRASVITGAILGGGTHEQKRCLEQYADHIGLAFQVADDILNVEGNPDLMGKAVGTDLKRNKSTYATVTGIAGSKALAERLVNSSLEALKEFDTKADPLRAAARYIIERKQ